MRIILSDNDFQNVLDSLDKTHREVTDKATSWSFDLDGDYDNYVELRTKELDLAKTIHILKRQRSNPATTAEEPLADWERELLNMDKNS